MKCPRCLNEDETYFYLGAKGYYCRRCIQFKRQLLEDDNDKTLAYELSQDYQMFLSYDLTLAQKGISRALSEAVLHHDVLLHCVCGAGKTEIVLETIQAYLMDKKRVAYAISRRQVVLELTKRFETIFKHALVIPVCQGYTDVLEADLIVLTTHQLYRYPKCFDLLILDEPDAFPFANNALLQDIARNSAKGHIIYSTATLNEELKMMAQNSVTLTLNKRPHGYDLPVPKLIVAPKLVLLYKGLRYIARKDKVIVFVPTIKQAKLAYILFRRVCRCDYISSLSDDKQRIIDDFNKGKTKVLFSTTILERGVTFKGVEVLIYQPEHTVFTIASLIQMIGRVGRSFEAPTGEALALSNEYSPKMKEVITILEKANRE